MLNALKSQLKTMASDPEDEFASLIRKRAGSGDAVRYEKELRNMILVMPDMLREIQHWAADDKTPANFKCLYGYLLAYLYNPEDLLPVTSFGLYGYLDDAYFVVRVYERTILEKWEAPKQALTVSLDQVASWRESILALFPQVSLKIERMIEDLLRGEEKGFLKILSRAAQKSQDDN